MKQIIQNLKTGDTVLEELPAPQVKAGQVQIQTSRSLVSLGSADYADFRRLNISRKGAKTQRERKEDKGNRGTVFNNL